MKKLLSILLTIVMFSTIVTPAVFAEETATTTEPVTYYYTPKSGNNITVTSESGMFGLSSENSAYFIKQSTGNHNILLLNGDTTSKPVTNGQKIKVSITAAGDPWYAYDGFLRPGLAMPGEISYNENIFGLGMKNSIGEITNYTTYGDYTLSADTPKSKVAIPNKTWITYDMVISVDSSGEACTCSFYTDGQPSFEDAEIVFGTKYAPITSVEAPGIVTVFRDGYNFYIADISMTIYPADYEGTIVEKNPFTAGDNFTAIDDGSYNLNNPSLTPADIATMGPEGWTYKYIGDNSSEGIADVGYIEMTSTSGTVYYKKIISSSYTNLLDFNCTSIWLDNKYSYNTNIRKTSSTNETTSLITGYEGKSSDNNAVMASWSVPAVGQINGFKATASGTEVGSGSHSTMIETGRLAYEASILIPSDGTRELAFEVVNNTSSNGTYVSDGKFWQALRIEPDGAAVFDGTSADGYEKFSFNQGEWYRLTAVLDTATKTGEFYINGEKAVTKEFETLDNLSLFRIGYLTRGNSPTDNDYFSFAFDDISIKRLRADWTPATLALSSNDENVSIDNKNGIIHGSFEDLQAFSDAVSVPADASYEFYTDETVTTVAEEGTVSRYLLVKNADETIIREYVITTDDLTVTGPDVSMLDTNAGDKSVTVSIENMKDASMNTMVVIASYNNGELIAVDSVTKSAAVKNTTDYTVTINVAEDKPVTEIKAFVWGADNLIPITPVVSTSDNN